jgi:hypothetical protein
MRTLGVLLLLIWYGNLAADQMPAPIIDMHLHASSAGANGPPPVAICAPFPEMPVQDPAKSWIETFTAWLKNPPCKNPIWGPETNEGVMKETLEILERRNIYAVTSGRLLETWKKAGGERIIPALWFGFMLQTTPSPAEVRKLFKEGKYRVFSEVAIQYDGISPSDPMFEPYLEVAEELDIPIGIHIGTGPPGAPYIPDMKNYRARLHSPLVLEEALLRHPKLRLFIMHGGWPMLDDLLAVLWAHPQVHLDVGVISFALPRKEFHRYLQRIVEAGFEKRVMFGSDQMNWPKTIDVAIEAINTADFLSQEQKRNILYNNAARFLRLSKEEIAKHHGK